MIHESPLNKHKSSVHERKKPYTCQDCNACFYKKADLNEHISSIHTDKKKLQSVPLTNFRFELIKAQCGRHSVSELAKFLTINRNTLRNKLKEFEIKFPTSPFGDPCRFRKQQISPLVHEKKDT